MSSQDLSTNHQEVLARIESYSKANLLSSASSVFSLESIDNTLSRLECFVTTASAPPMPIASSARSPRTPDSQDCSGDLLAPPDTSQHKVSKMMTRAQFELPRISLRKTTLSEQAEKSNDHNLLHELTEEIYPKIVADYISSSRSVALFESHLALVKARIRNEHSATKNDDADSRLHFYKLVTQSQQLENYLSQLRETVKGYRKQCMQSGHPLHELDADLCLSMDYQRTRTMSTSECHEDMFEIRRRTLDSGLLKDWTSTRDRINSWLLHSLRSDDSHVRLHRSLLAEQEVDGSEWATLVLRYWTVDEAATGLDLTTSLSVGATHSHTDFSNMESAVDYNTCYESLSNDPGEQ